MQETRLDTARIRAARRVIDPVFLDTALYCCPALEPELGCAVSIKLETANPVRSFKARGTEVVASRLADHGVPAVVCASAGNLGQALAWSGRGRGLDVTVVASRAAPAAKLDRIRALDARLQLVDGDFDRARARAAALARYEGIRLVEDSLDIETCEGAATIGLELVEAVPSFDAVLIALGGGALATGVGHVVKACAPDAEVICVQPRGAPAMTRSWRQRRVVTTEATHTIADGVAGRRPIPAALDDLLLSKVGLLTSAYATVMGGVAAVASGVAVPISQAAPGGWYTALGCWIVLALMAIVLWLPQLLTPRPPSEAIRRHRLPWGSALAWAVTAFMGLQSLGFYVVVTWLPQVFQDSGVSAAKAGWLLFVFQAVAVLTSLAVPALLRRAHDQRALATLSSAVVLAGYLGLMAAPGWALLWSVVLGLGGGACLVLALAFLSLRAQDATAAGALSAMAQSIGYLLAAAGPAVFGLLHTISSGWQAPIILMCITAAGQMIVALVAGRGMVRPVGGQTPDRIGG